MANSTGGGTDPSSEASIPDPTAPAADPATPPRGIVAGVSSPPPGFAPVIQRTPTAADLYGTPFSAPPSTPPAAQAPPGSELGKLSKTRGGVRWVVLLVIALAVLGGAVFFVLRKGTDDRLTKPGSPGAAIEAYDDALRSDDVERACAQLSERARATIADGDCAKAFAMLVVYRKSQGKADIQRVKIDRDRATVSLQSGSTVQLVSEGGTWKIDQGPTEVPRTSTTTEEECESTRSSLGRAITTYEAENGKPPANVQALVEANLLAEVPRGAEINPDGTVTMVDECA